MAKTIYMGSDHAGLALKNALIPFLRQDGWSIEDMGATSGESCDYPDFAHAVCTKVLENGAFGILICGTGIGMSMAANRHKGIRAALCTHEFHARATRGWRGTRSAWLSIIGFVAVLFNFTIVNMFFQGLHSYSGLT